MAQRSLTNIAKHAKASRVDIKIRKNGNQIRMAISDNGKSFGTEATKPGRREQRLGLLGMKERVRLVSGKFTIQSEPGNGTSVLVNVPLAGQIETE